MSRHELTARIAYEIYVQRGHAPGRHREDWLAAEAIVAMCLAFAEELLRASEATATPAPKPETTLQERALTLLLAAVDEVGRKAVASTLGYKSASTVGRYVRGDSQIGEALARKIVARLGAESSRRAA